MTMQAVLTGEDAKQCLDAMVEEAQVEAGFCRDPFEAELCLARRDALRELAQRVREGKRNNWWTRKERRKGERRQ